MNHPINIYAAYSPLWHLRQAEIQAINLAIEYQVEAQQLAERAAEKLEQAMEHASAISRLLSTGY